MIDKRKSWDTTIKHYYRKGLDSSLPEKLKYQIPSSNISRWRNESDDKYLGCDIAEYINQEIELIKELDKTQILKN